jgi:hypothetical protein
VSHAGAAPGRAVGTQAAPRTRGARPCWAPGANRPGKTRLGRRASLRPCGLAASRHTGHVKPLGAASLRFGAASTRRRARAELVAPGRRAGRPRRATALAAPRARQAGEVRSRLATARVEAARRGREPSGWLATDHHSEGPRRAAATPRRELDRRASPPQRAR